MLQLVDIGTATLSVGDAPSVFDMLQYRQSQAYMFVGTFGTYNFNTVWSRLSISAVIFPTNSPSFYHPIVHTIEIRETPFSFWVPMSRTFGNNGDFMLEVERLSNIRGTAESEPPIELTLAWDESERTGSWRD